MNILILGAGGREHAFAWKISQSPLCKELFVAPGNSGTSTLATNLNISVTDFEGIKRGKGKDVKVLKKINLLQGEG